MLVEIDPTVVAEAVRLVDRYGAEAEARADENSRAFLAIGDLTNLRHWRRIHAAILQLERTGHPAARSAFAGGEITR